MYLSLSLSFFKQLDFNVLRQIWQIDDYRDNGCAKYFYNIICTKSNDKIMIIITGILLIIYACGANRFS